MNFPSILWDEGDGKIMFGTIVALAVFVAMLARAGKKGKRKRSPTRKQRNKSTPKMAPTVGTVKKVPSSSSADRPVTKAPQQTPVPPSTKEPKGNDGWLGPGCKSVEVAGVTIPGGLLYVGSRGRGTNVSNGYIDRNLPVRKGAVPDSAAVPPLPYWPNYANISPDQRRIYIDWLVGGRQDPRINVGYVFLYFYGLEHRICTSATSEDIDAIEAELNRLRTIYDENGSFKGYSSRLLGLIALQRLGKQGPGLMAYRPSMVFGFELPIDLKLVLALHLAQKKGLDAKLVAPVLAVLRYKGAGEVPWYIDKVPREFCTVLENLTEKDS